jgi:anti-sigma factor RsiW
MKCDRIENLLVGYREGSLGARDRALVEAHLAECPDCRRLLDLLKETERAFEGFPVLEVGPALRRKLYALPDRESEKAEARTGSWLGFVPRLVRQPVFVPAAVILLAATIFATNPHRDAMLRTVYRQVHLGWNAAGQVYDKAGAFLDKLNGYKEETLSSLKRVDPLSRDGNKNKRRPTEA